MNEFQVLQIAIDKGFKAGVYGLDEANAILNALGVTQQALLNQQVNTTKKND